jgi:hypothetical protein
VKRCYGIVGDTLNRIAHAIHESKIEWVQMRHEEAGAFALVVPADISNAAAHEERFAANRLAPAITVRLVATIDSVSVLQTGRSIDVHEGAEATQRG